MKEPTVEEMIKWLQKKNMHEEASHLAQLLNEMRNPKQDYRSLGLDPGVDQRQLVQEELHRIINLNSMGFNIINELKELHKTLRIWKEADMAFRRNEKYVLAEEDELT